MTQSKFNVALLAALLVALLVGSGAAVAQEVTVPEREKVGDYIINHNGQSENFTLRVGNGQRISFQFDGGGQVHLRCWKRVKWKRNHWTTDFVVSSGDIVTTKMDYNKSIGRMAVFGKAGTTVTIWLEG